MELPPRDFESRASTNFATPARQELYSLERNTGQEDCDGKGQNVAEGSQRGRKKQSGCRVDLGLTQVSKT